ncbi:MAG: hypothetical protein GY884_10795 [Proteobacteria bacterium]|nr:hypothetical protein [Pseudomonadota bacterium]
MSLLLLALGSAWAEPPAEARTAGVPADVQPEPSEPVTGVTFFALAQTKVTASNVVTTNPFFDGQVVGTLGGTSGVEVSDEDTSIFAEQRAAAFLGYRPALLDGKAGLNTAFEVDFAWGDASYGIGGNTGGGFGGDQVNLQTRRLNADFQSELAGHEQTTVVGLQWLGDGVAMPTDGLDAVFRSGGRGTVFASEAAGVTVYGRGERVDYRLAGATLVENASATSDDVGLLMADLQIASDWRSSIGVHAWSLVDRSGGTGGALGVGPASALAELQGASSLDIGPTDATLGWLGADAGFNADLRRGDVGAHGVVIGNVGTLVPETGPELAVRGVLADIEGRWRYQPGAGSVLRGEVLYVSGDDPRDATYTGFITGNSYGAVGAVHATHGTLLLHPDLLSINRQVSQTGDVAAGGRGQLSLTGSLGYDPIPDRLTVQVGAGHAAYGGGTSAQELNARVIAQPLLFLRTGLSGAYLARPDEDAWIVYASLDWLVI